MAKFSLRRYSTQARVSVIIGIVSVLSLIAMAGLVFRHVDFSEWSIYYGRPWRKQLIFFIAAVTLLAGTVAIGLGFNSAGQRRNDRPRESWLGFFMGAAAICLTLVLVFIFHTRAEFLTR